MANSGSDPTLERLDRIEANLETVSQVLLRISGVVESNRGDIDQLSERIGQLAQSISSLRESQVETKFSVDRLIDTFVRFQEEGMNDRARISHLEQVASDFIQNAEADRAIMLQILEYLRNQYPGNGRGLTTE